MTASASITAPSSACARCATDVIDPTRSIPVGIQESHGARKDCGIRIVYGHEVEDMTATQIAQTILAHVGDMPCYVTFDIDCLDPAFAPGTGTPVAGGPSSARMLSVLQNLGALDIKGADIVEVAPAYDHADITAIAGAAVAMHYLGLLAERRSRR